MTTNPHTDAIPRMELTIANANALREEFDPRTVGLLPKPYDKNAAKKNCQECGGYHSPGVHIPYIGHAAVTDRLLAVDPYWNWEPVVVDEYGFPALSRNGDLWIRLTVCGVTRLGVGDGNSIKEKIGDALRNAAMRFGVALQMWSKAELEFAATVVPNHTDDTPDPDQPVPADSKSANAALRALIPAGIDPASGEIETDEAYAAAGGQDTPKLPQKVMRALQASFRDAGISDRDEKLSYCGWAIRHDGPIASTNDLTPEEASTVISALKERVRKEREEVQP